MNTKLTLNIDKNIVSEAKGYAKEKQTSISRLVEQYLRFLTLQSEKAEKYEKNKKSIVDELTGIISLPEGFDEKEIIASYLIEKYAKK